MDSKSWSSNFDERNWVIQIRRTIEEELEDESEIPVSVFNVPKILVSSDPDSFTPQQVAFGPYHHRSPEVYEMERYKLAAAKRCQKQLQSLKFHSLVEELTKFELRIRACYHKYLDLKSETLAWMMAIDASFLLEFLQIYAVKEAKLLARVSSRMSHLVDFAGRKWLHNMILRDIVMLENQIPLFVLRKMLELLHPSPDLADVLLADMLMGLHKELSPFKMMKNLPKIQVSQSAHVLDFLYDMIVPKSHQIVEEIIEVDEQNEAMNDRQNASGDSSSVKKFLDLTWQMLSKLDFLKNFLILKPIQLISNLPWKDISNIPGFSVLKQFPSQQKEETKPDNNENKPPLVEEITIPCVTELVESGIRFSPTNGNISTINFDSKTLTLYLPTICLDISSEVVLRNLVAYEASNASGPLVFTRYTELMNGIIDTEEDAKLLRKQGIIVNRLKSDEEVAKMWNGMSKSIRLTKVSFLDTVIEDVNKYYNGRWKTKAQKFLKVYVFGSWQVLTFLATIMVLLLMTLQAFCSVYNCARVFKLNNTV